MPHRDPDDDVDDADDFRGGDPPAPPRPRANNTGLVVGLVVGGAVLLVLLVCGGAIALFALRAGPPVPGQPVATAIDEQPVPDRPKAREMVKKGDATKRIYTQDEFKMLVLGKTEADVIAAVGRPPVVAARPLRWTYRDCIADPNTGRAESVTIVFENGKVVEIQW